jgi:hypothetical protein
VQASSTITNTLVDGANRTVEADHTGEEDEDRRPSPDQQCHKVNRSTLQYRYVTDAKHTISNRLAFRGQNNSFLRQLEIYPCMTSEVPFDY